MLRGISTVNLWAEDLPAATHWSRNVTPARPSARASSHAAPRISARDASRRSAPRSRFCQHAAGIRNRQQVMPTAASALASPTPAPGYRLAAQDPLTPPRARQPPTAGLPDSTPTRTPGSYMPIPTASWLPERRGGRVRHTLVTFPETPPRHQPVNAHGIGHPTRCRRGPGVPAAPQTPATRSRHDGRPPSAHRAWQRHRRGRTRSRPTCADFGSMSITMLAVQIWAFCASTAGRTGSLVTSCG